MLIEVLNYDNYSEIFNANFSGNNSMNAFWERLQFICVCVRVRARESIFCAPTKLFAFPLSPGPKAAPKTNCNG